MVAHGEMAVASEEYLVETAFASCPFVLFHELVEIDVLLFSVASEDVVHT